MKTSLAYTYYILPKMSSQLGQSFQAWVRIMPETKWTLVNGGIDLDSLSMSKTPGACTIKLLQQ